MWQFYTCMHNRKFFSNHFFAILYLRSLFQMPFLNSKSLKNIKPLLFYQVFYNCRNWLIIQLSIDGLHTFYHKCLTTSLFTYNINKNYQTYISVISCYCCCSKLVDALYDVAYCSILYCQRHFIGFIYFFIIVYQLLCLSMI